LAIGRAAGGPIVTPSPVADVEEMEEAVQKPPPPPAGDRSGGGPQPRSAAVLSVYQVLVGPPRPRRGARETGGRAGSRPVVAAMGDLVAPLPSPLAHHPSGSARPPAIESMTPRGWGAVGGGVWVVGRCRREGAARGPILSRQRVCAPVVRVVSAAKARGGQCGDCSQATALIAADSCVLC